MAQLFGGAPIGGLPSSSRTMAYGQSLLSSNQGTPRNFGEGLDSMGKSLMGALMLAKSGWQSDSENEKLAAALAGSPGMTPEIKAMMQSDDAGTRAAGSQLAMAMLARETKPETFGLETVAGPDGKPMLVQAGNRGTLSPVQGFQPYSEPKAPSAFEAFLAGDPRAAEWKQMGVPRVSNNVNVGGAKYGPIPPGFRLIEQGDTAYMEALPGSPADQEAKDRVLGEKDQLKYTNIVSEDLDKAIDIVKENPNTVSGALGSVLQSIPGTKARDLRGLVSTIKTNVGIDRIISMKKAAGGQGSISDSEKNDFQSAMGALDLDQSDEMILRNLTRLRDVTNKIVFGDGAKSQKSTPQQAQPGISKMGPAEIQSFIESKGGEANLTPAERAAIDSQLKAMGF